MKEQRIYLPHVAGGASPPRRYDFAFPAVIGDSINGNPYPAQPTDQGMPRLYDWSPCFRHVGRTSVYRLLVARNPDGSIAYLYWGLSDNDSRAQNTAERHAYERFLNYPYTPAGMPVVMHVTWLCDSAPVGLLPPSGPPCQFFYWFYHWSDPYSVLCPTP